MTLIILFYFSFNFHFHAPQHTSALHAFDFPFNDFHHVYMFSFIAFLCFHFSTIYPTFFCLHFHLSFFLTFLSYIQCPLYRHSCGQSDRHSPLHLLSLIYRSVCRTKSRSVFKDRSQSFSFWIYFFQI